MRSGLLAVVLLACSAAPRSVNRNAERIAIVDGAVFRTEDDDTVGVVVHVTLGDLTAPGTVRLRDVDLAAAPRSRHLRYARARAWQALAEMAPTAEVAFDAALNGALELEGSYSIRGLHDDSSQRLDILRSVRQSTPQRLPELVGGVKRILHKRLQRYAQAWRAELR